MIHFWFSVKATIYEVRSIQEKSMQHSWQSVCQSIEQFNIWAGHRFSWTCDLSNPPITSSENSHSSSFQHLKLCIRIISLKLLIASVWDIFFTNYVPRLHTFFGLPCKSGHFGFGDNKVGIIYHLNNVTNFGNCIRLNHSQCPKKNIRHKYYFSMLSKSVKVKMAGYIKKMKRQVQVYCCEKCTPLQSDQICPLVTFPTFKFMSHHHESPRRERAVRRYSVDVIDIVWFIRRVINVQ